MADSRKIVGSLSDNLTRIEEDLRTNSGNPAICKDLERVALNFKKKLGKDTKLNERFESLYNKAINETAKSRVNRSRLLFKNFTIPKPNEVADLNLKEYLKPDKNAGLKAFADDYNHTNSYIKLDILFSQNYAESLLAMNRWLKVLNLCLKKHDYHSVFTIASAFSHAKIQSLYGDKDRNYNSYYNYLSYEQFRFINAVNTFIDDAKNYRYMRTAINKAIEKNNSPVPYSGLLTRDLAYVLETVDRLKEENAKNNNLNSENKVEISHIVETKVNSPNEDIKKIDLSGFDPLINLQKINENIVNSKDDSNWWNEIKKHCVNTFNLSTIDDYQAFDDLLYTSSLKNSKEQQEKALKLSPILKMEDTISATKELMETIEAPDRFYVKDIEIALEKIQKNPNSNKIEEENSREEKSKEENSKEEKSKEELSDEFKKRPKLRYKGMSFYSSETGMNYFYKLPKKPEQNTSNQDNKDENNNSNKI